MPPTLTPAKLKAWRLDLRMRQVDAARFFTVSERQWRRYENGESRIPRWIAGTAALTTYYTQLYQEPEHHEHQAQAGDSRRPSAPARSGNAPQDPGAPSA